MQINAVILLMEVLLKNKYVSEVFMFHVFAYLDPSTGSLFVQAFIGSIAGASFVFRNSLSKLAGKLTRHESAEKTR